jgi:D-lactate dehydrogenase
MKVAFFSTKSYDRAYFEKHIPSMGYDFTYFEAQLTCDTANLINGHDAVCVFVNDRLDKKTIQCLSAKGIKLIALRCAGFNNVDLDSAEKAGIRIVRVPAYSPQAVAEHAMALILTLNRKTHKAYNRIREGNFSLERLTGFNLHNKTVGVIGTGQIGAAFCSIIKGFGCKVLAFDIHESDKLKDLGIKYADMDRLLNESDIISLHCPLNEHTRHLICSSSIDKMKRNVMIINTSRGALINTRDVIGGLKKGHIGALGIDVYEQEEHLFFRDLSESIILDDQIARLMTFPNVLITAHQGFFTREALDEIARVTLQNLNDFAAGNKLCNEVKA